MMASFYDFKKVEEKWIKKFEELGAFHTDVKSSKKPKFYNLAMFPYPSAAALHMGHAYTYGGVDTYGRFKRHMGYNVFQPMGFDAFGIHGENYAIKVNRHPSDVLEENMTNFRRQMDRLGAMFDWSHSVNTTDPDYYKWTQWIFVQLFKAGLAERKSSLVNWCPSCKTVLSDEQVIQGKCERCGTVTEKKEMLQWFFKITDYAQKLLDNHAKMDWSAKTILAQKNWIGRSEGAEITFSVVDEQGSEIPEKINVFTTRPDTIFGVTFVVLSIKHALIARIPNKYYEKVSEYIEEAQSQTALDTQKDKTGEFTGLYAINPLNGERIPVFVANYVLPGYGTGALMGVPGHDSRDFEFANKYGIEIKRVIESEIETQLPYEDEGVLIDSGNFTGMDSSKAREEIVNKLEDMGVGKEQINYKLRDWLISRQRYWGPPIPIIYCDECGTVPVEDLPVFLPNVADFTPKGDGKSPLASIDSFVNTTCPKCGGKARRETDVLDNFVDSSWYFLRYPSVGINNVAFDPELTKKWLPVDMYIGGNEHAVLHLLYTRFIVIALHDLGYLEFDEPFNKFRVNGLIIKDGAKMSKSKGNVVNPDDYMNLYGTDVVRMYLLFIGPFADGGDFSDKNIVGIARFLDRVWALQNLESGNKLKADLSDVQNLIVDITEDIENLRYNTSISSLMEYTNWVYKHAKDVDKETLGNLIRDLVVMVSVYAPFMSEELWEILGGKGLVLDAAWPKIKRVKRENVNMPVQVNGRVRGVINLAIDTKEDAALKTALSENGINKFVGDSKIQKVIFVQNKILNIIV